MEVVWTPTARRQLAEIVDYVALDSPSRAVAFAEKLQEAVTGLRRFPLMGRFVPERVREPVPPRELLIRDYRIVYRIRPGRVQIMMVFHGMRRFPGP